MSEKKHPPSAHRLQKLRKEGNVSRSAEFSQALALAAGLAVVSFLLPSWIASLAALLRTHLSASAIQDVVRSPEKTLACMGSARAILSLTTPLLLSLFIVSGLTTFIQTGPVFAIQALKPKLANINPVQGFQKIFLTAHTYVQLLKTLIKFVAVLAIALLTIKRELPNLVQTSSLDPDAIRSFATDTGLKLLFRVSVLFVVLGAADLFLTRRQFMKQHRMSDEELKQEYKEQDGDPEMKAHQRRFQQELMQPLESAVPTATGVVRNPTHVAIAFRFDDTTSAPEVVAKGKGPLALRIIELADRHRVPSIHNIPLAHRLYEVEVGDQIPEDLYVPMAEVIRFIQSLEKKRRKAREQ